VCGGYGVSAPSLKANQVAARDCVEEWCQQVRECRKETDLIVWASDSNFVKDSSVDRRVGQGNSRVANNKMDASEHLYSSFVEGSELKDSWCQVHGGEVGCTRTEWKGARGEVANQSRIDHIFLSDRLSNACIGAGVQDGVGAVFSDHYMIVTEVCITRATGMDLRLHSKHCESVRRGQNKVQINKFNKESWGVCRDNLQDWWDHQGVVAYDNPLRLLVPEGNCFPPRI
jgi:hypothetical protein